MTWSPKLTLKWCDFPQHRLSRLWNMQRHCGTRCYDAIKAPMSMSWKELLLNAYQMSIYRRMKSYWGSRMSTTVYDLAHHGTTLTKLQRGSTTRTQSLIATSTIIREEIVDAKTVKLIMPEQVGPRLSHRWRTMRLEHQQPRRLHKYGITRASQTALVFSAIVNEDNW